MKLTLLFLSSLFINFYLGYNLYNRSELIKARLTKLNTEHYEEVKKIKEQLSYYDDTTLNSVFGKLFPNATDIGCPTDSPNTGELSQDTPK